MDKQNERERKEELKLVKEIQHMEDQEKMKEDLKLRSKFRNV